MTADNAPNPLTDDIEIYTPARIAEFLLGNSTNAAEYAAAIAEVKRMGLDPNRIDHFQPKTTLNPNASGINADSHRPAKFQ
jgi:hypothetical protein